MYICHNLHSTLNIYGAYNMWVHVWVVKNLHSDKNNYHIITIINIILLIFYIAIKYSNFFKN